MAIGIGQALALGNLAQVDRSKPFTNAVMNRQRLDLADQQNQAKQKQQAQEQQKYLNSLLKFGEGGFTPFYQEQAAQIANEGLQKQIQYRNEGNQVAMMQSAAEMKAKLDDLKLQQDATADYLKLKEKGYIIPKELEQGFSGIRSQSEKGIQDFLKNNPQYSEIVKYDPVTRSYSFNPIKDIDLNKSYDDVIQANESQMTDSKFLRKIDNNTSVYEFSLSKDQLTNLAAQFGTNRTYIDNLKLKDTKRFNEELKRVSTEIPEISIQQAESIAAAKIAEENLAERNKRRQLNSIALPRPAPKPDEKNNVNTAVTTSNQTTTNPIFGPNRPVTTVHISTPPKGENEKTTFEANTAFIDDNGTKRTINLKGKPISGSIVEIKAAPAPGGKKEVYAIVESDIITNKEIHPEKYASVLAKKPNKLTAEEKQLVDEANNKSKQLYYVPLRDVAKNWQAELKRYNNTDIINRLENELGIKYTDYIQGDSQQSKNTTQSAGKKKIAGF